MASHKLLQLRTKSPFKTAIFSLSSHDISRDSIQTEAVLKYFAITSQGPPPGDHLSVQIRL